MTIPIPGYEGLYSVGDGYVISHKRIYVSGNGAIKELPERILPPVKSQYGYAVINLNKDGKQKQFFIHRLVAAAYIPNPENLPCVLHKDDNRMNPKIDNLFWGSKRDNSEDSHRKGRHIKPKRPVVQYGKEGNLIAKYESTREAARQTGVIQSNLWKCCQGKLKSAGGYKWSYL